MEIFHFDFLPFARLAFPKWHQDAVYPQDFFYWHPNLL